MARREYQKPNVLKSRGKKPYWYVRYRIRVYDEKRRKWERPEKWHRLGDCETMSKREAERERDKLVGTVNTQVLNLREQIPFRDFVKLYQTDFMPNLGKGTQQKYKSLLHTHILPAFGGARLADMKTQEIQVFLTAKKQENLSWWARSDLRNLLSGLFTKAADWGYWSKRNPVAGTVIGDKEWKRDNRALLDDEVRKLMNSLEAGSALRLIVETLVTTGMRTSEIFGLKWKYVDLDAAVIQVRERNYRGDQSKPKSRKSKRDLPINGLVAKYREFKPANASPEDFVFNDSGEPLDERSVLRYQLKPAARAVGLDFEGFGWHSFRRTHLTAFSEAGATAFETRDQAGHSKIDTTMSYVKPSAERISAAVQKVVDRLLPENSAGIVREEQGVVPAYVIDSMVGPTELESVTSTVSR